MGNGGRRIERRGVRGAGALGLAVLLLGSPAHGWIIAEHGRLTHDAIAALSPAERALLDTTWRQARLALEADARPRLCEQSHLPRLAYQDAPAVGRDERSYCVTFSTLPALAADHACSPRELRAVVEGADWLRNVLRVGLTIETQIREADGDPNALDDVRRELDVELQIYDRAYGDRAKVNTTHFLPPRRSATLEEFLADSLAGGEVANVVALWAGYHAAALELAAEAGRCARHDGADAAPGCAPMPNLLWRMLTLEAFALHFLQDAFSSGHVVGAWGGTAQRKGTHDYYSRRGLDAQTWRGETYSAHGDIFMTDEDVRRVVVASVSSLRQLTLLLAPTASTTPAAPPSEATAATATLLAAAASGRVRADLDVCTSGRVPPGLERLARAAFVAEVVRDWPRPPARVPALPRVSTEYGGFLSSSAGLQTTVLWPTSGELAEGEAGARLGVGAGWSGDGMLSSQMYGRVFVEALVAGVHNAPRADSALGLGFRIQIPYFLVPGDIVVWLPLAFGTGEAWMAQQAALGGLLRLNRPVRVADGVRMQLLVGREASVLWYLPRGEGEARRPLRFELDVPLIELAVDTAFHEGLGERWATSLGLSYVDMGGELEPFFGAFVAGSFQARYTP